MKRSEINYIIREAKEFLSEHRFYLPEWAYWSASTWKEKEVEGTEIINNSLGWDITDFGSDDFSKCGLVLFTLRNGNLNTKDKPYCEKIMIVGEEQETPMHRHWNKTEDIINRGGGNLVLELYLAKPDDSLSGDAFQVSIDGIAHTVMPGNPLILKPGQSICLTPDIFHRFYGQKGEGKVLVGEVSSINDDKNDNCFYRPLGRFPSIDEDVAPLYLLVSDYSG